MKRYHLISIFLVLVFSCKDTVQENEKTLPTVFESSGGQQSATYLETIDFYLTLAREYPEINVQTIGTTDSGYPLHLVTYNPDGDFSFSKLRDDKTIMLINNGIHPGEPDGIDASMVLLRDLAQGILPTPENVVISTIPVYNVGGMLNRNGTTRVNQNGPLTYGFRGNSLNYDLNRDFMKMDSKNAKTFSTIFHLVKPDIFIDNHVSNGADYQYVLTHLFTQHDKLGSDLGTFLNTEIMPGLETELSKKEWDITPYVNVFNRPPDQGFKQFLDHPRYSTGYTTLWNTFGMMVETHMLKPYKKRVEGTYELMRAMIDIVNTKSDTIKSLRNSAKDRFLKLKHYRINWVVDTTKNATLNFKGYKADTLISEITGLPRLKYDISQPFTKEIVYQDSYIAKDSIEVPAAYVIKKEWQSVLELLETNQIEFSELEQDTSLLVESYRINSFETYTQPYEGHYPHYNTTVSKTETMVKFRKGDYLIPIEQEGIRYLLEALEPEAVDSFFNWNFFDTILQQKEGFSPYVFEDLALKILEKDAELKSSFELKKQNEPVFKENWYAQLDWIYKHSQHYEPAHMQYPIFRVARGSDAAKLLKD